MLRIIYALSLFIMLTFIQMPTAHLAQAKQPPPRFVELQNNDLAITQFDTKTIKYEKDPYRDELLVNVWIKTSNERITSYSLSNYIFRINKREIMQLDKVDFNGNDQITNKTKHVYDPISWASIIPETTADKWYISIMDYVKKNEKTLKNDYNRTKDMNQKDDSGFFSPILDFLSL
jgi:hypothetical protein